MNKKFVGSFTVKTVFKVVLRMSLVGAMTINLFMGSWWSAIWKAAPPPINAHLSSCRFYRCAQQFLQTPNVIRNSTFHCWVTRVVPCIVQKL